MLRRVCDQTRTTSMARVLAGFWHYEHVIDIIADDVLQTGSLGPMNVSALKRLAYRMKLHLLMQVKSLMSSVVP